MTRLEVKTLTLDLVVLYNIALKQIIQSIELRMSEHDEKKRLDLIREIDLYIRNVYQIELNINHKEKNLMHTILYNPMKIYT